MRLIILTSQSKNIPAIQPATEMTNVPTYQVQSSCSMTAYTAKYIAYLKLNMHFLADNSAFHPPG